MSLAGPQGPQPPTVPRAIPESETRIPRRMLRRPNDLASMQMTGHRPSVLVGGSHRKPPLRSPLALRGASWRSKHNRAGGRGHFSPATRQDPRRGVRRLGPDPGYLRLRGGDAQRVKRPPADPGAAARGAGVLPAAGSFNVALAVARSCSPCSGACSCGRCRKNFVRPKALRWRPPSCPARPKVLARLKRGIAQHPPRGVPL